MIILLIRLTGTSVPYYSIQYILNTIVYVQFNETA